MAQPAFYKALAFTDSSSFEMQNNVIIHKEVNANFKLMANAYKTDKGKDILVEQSYISIFQHYDELRKAVTDDNIKKMLYLTTDILTAATPTGKGPNWLIIKGKLDSLQYESTYLKSDYFNETTGLVWENPITTGVYIPKPNQIIQPVKDKPALIDPRRTGRWIQTTPGIIPGDYAWFLNNSIKYGFIPYGPSSTNMLFYITSAEIQAVLTSDTAPIASVQNLVTIFTPVAAGDTNLGKAIKDQIITTAKLIRQGPPPAQSRGGGKGFSQAAIASITKYLRTKGCSNVFIAACCAIASKESGGVPKNEYGWGSTNDLGRIREFFGNRLWKPGWGPDASGVTPAPKGPITRLTDAELIAIKANNRSFFDKIYGPGGPYVSGAKGPQPAAVKQGSKDPGDGDRYRGRGFNGITFKSAYEKYQKIILATYPNIDIVANPDGLNDPIDGFGPSAIALGEYMFSNVGKPDSTKRNKILTFYKGRQLPSEPPVAENLYQSNNKDHCIRACMHANAGWGTDPNQGTWMSEGEGRALQNYPTLLAAVESVK